MRCHNGITNHDCRTLRRPIEHTCTICNQATRQNEEIESVNAAVHQSIREQQIATNTNNDEDGLPNLISGSSSGDDTVLEVDIDDHTRPIMTTIAPAREMIQVATTASPVQMTAIDGTQRTPNTHELPSIISPVRPTHDPSAATIEYLNHAIDNIQRGFQTIVQAGTATQAQRNVASVFDHLRRSLAAVATDRTILDPTESGQLNEFVVDMRDQLEAALRLVTTDPMRTTLIASACSPRITSNTMSERDEVLGANMAQWYEEAMTAANGPLSIMSAAEGTGRPILRIIREWMRRLQPMTDQEVFNAACAQPDWTHPNVLSMPFSSLLIPPTCGMPNELIHRLRLLAGCNDHTPAHHLAIRRCPAAQRNHVDT